MPTIHLQIKGKVQGVFYRATAKEIADKLEITGWIKNTISGDVEAIATGSEKHLYQFVLWCKKGPSGANVEEVILVDEEAETPFKEFTIL